nr:unnamed protein product [Spodoptera littoralis]
MIATKLFIFALFAGVLAVEEKPVAEIITESTIVNPDGYSFDFKTSDGISRHEDASLITVGDKQGIAVKGSYSYLTPGVKSTRSHSPLTTKATNQLFEWSPPINNLPIFRQEPPHIAGVTEDKQM